MLVWQTPIPASSAPTPDISRGNDRTADKPACHGDYTNAYCGNNGRAAILAGNVKSTGQNQHVLTGNTGVSASPGTIKPSSS
jgi:hypothetical protein